MVATTLDARMIVRSSRGERTLAPDAFFQGIMTTAIEPDELLAEARLPALPDDTRFGFEEFSRRVGDFAIAMVLATYRLADGVMVEPRIGVGGAEELPRRMAAAEAVLTGRAPEAAAFADAAEAAAAAVDPMTDINTSAEYRRDLVRALTRRALERAAA
jgi:carbon-monoxide dehydrogenase medium subunit